MARFFRRGCLLPSTELVTAVGMPAERTATGWVREP